MGGASRELSVISPESAFKNLVRASLDEYIRFNVMNMGQEHAVEAVKASLKAMRVRYSKVDKRFISLTQSTTKNLPGYSGIDEGIGVGFMLLKAAGLSESEIENSASLIPGLVSGAATQVQLNGNGIVERLPSVKSITDVPRTKSYEAPADLSFFDFMGSEGPGTVRMLIAESGLAEKDIEVMVQHDQNTIKSPRVTNRILFVHKESGDIKAAYLVKIPHNHREIDAALYAGSRVVKFAKGEKTLGPKTVVVGDYLVEEDLSLKADNLRKTGFTLTEEEALAFGRQMALDLVAMCTDDRYLYFSNQPTHIKIGGKGLKNLITQMID
jgi:hypothetical protein